MNNRATRRQESLKNIRETGATLREDSDYHVDRLVRRAFAKNVKRLQRRK